MIGKKVPNPNKSASKSVRVTSVTDYVVDPERERERELEREKCVYEGSRGFLLAEDHEGRKAEMLALALVAVKSPDPIDHWVLSWQEGEQPTRQQIEQAVDLFAQELGVQDHQMIYALHADTENYHLHIVLNRVHPETEKVVKINQGFDREAAQYAIERIEELQGWKREAGAIHRERDEKGHIIRVGERVLQPNSKALQFEARTGTKSAERIAQEEAAPIIRDAQSWAELHKRLADAGIEYQQKGSGAVLKIGDLLVKASKAGCDCGMSALTERLGEFRSGQNVAVEKRAPESVKSEQKEQWKAYLEAREKWREEKSRNRAAMQKRHGEERKQAQAAYKQRRQDLLQSRGNWKGYGQILNAQRSVLAARQAALMAELRERQKQERGEFHAQRPRFPDFELWMREQRQAERADAFRYRHNQARIVGAEYDPPRPRDIRDFTAEINHGAVLYRARGERAVSFVDRGKQIDISQANDRSAVLAALQLSAQKWGNFYVYGNDDYKRLCVELAAQHGFKIANPELQAAIREAREPKHEQPAVTPLARGADAGEVYRKHHEDITARQNGDGRIDPSRLDAMIAVRMRATGHNRSEIVEALEKCAPTIRSNGEKRDWKKYADRTAVFAFGPGGERQLAQLKRYVPQWARLEGIEPGTPQPLQQRAQRKAEPTRSERLLTFADTLKQEPLVVSEREAVEGALNADQQELAARAGRLQERFTKEQRENAAEYIRIQLQAGADPEQVQRLCAAYILDGSEVAAHYAAALIDAETERRARGGNAERGGVAPWAEKPKAVERRRDPVDHELIEFLKKEPLEKARQYVESVFAARAKMQDTAAWDEYCAARADRFNLPRQGPGQEWKDEEKKLKGLKKERVEAAAKLDKLLARNRGFFGQKKDTAEISDLNRGIERLDAEIRTSKETIRIHEARWEKEKPAFEKEAAETNAMFAQARRFLPHLAAGKAYIQQLEREERAHSQRQQRTRTAGRSKGLVRE